MHKHVAHELQPVNNEGMARRYEDRRDAGQVLAHKLLMMGMGGDVLVLALPRGGVEVGVEISKALGAPLDLMLVRKLGMPGDEEFAIGAIAMGGIRLVDEETVGLARLSLEQLTALFEREEAELGRRNKVYRKGAPFPDLTGRTVLLVDDGMATGADMMVAIKACRQAGAERVVAVTPVSSRSAYERVLHEADDLVCPFVPDVFLSVGGHYDDFRQLDDDDVIALMTEAEGSDRDFQGVVLPGIA